MSHSLATRGAAASRCRDDGIVSGLVRRLVDAWQRWQLLREREALRKSLAGLSDATLRDLGLTRGELGSIAAEMVGESGPTRARVEPGLRSRTP